MRGYMTTSDKPDYYEVYLTKDQIDLIIRNLRVCLAMEHIKDDLFEIPQKSGETQIYELVIDVLMEATETDREELLKKFEESFNKRIKNDYQD